MNQKKPGVNAHNSEKRELIISKGWIQAAVLVFLFGFFVLGYLGWRNYSAEPPIPQKTIDPSGQVLFTRADVLEGQQVFLRNGLMEYGSIFGHGAYLGPDYTTDYLHRAAQMVVSISGGADSSLALANTISEFKTNRYNPETGVLEFTNSQALAYDSLKSYYLNFFSTPSTKYGLRPEAITDSMQINQLTSYFAWSAWAAAALRPGEKYSYTNNWPPEQLVGNKPTAENIMWSVISLIALLGGIGLMMGAFGRWNFLGWHGRDQQTVSFIEPGKVALTPAQRATVYYFFIMSLLFLAQALLGGSVQHYRTELSNFFGIDLGKILPFNLARTWHLQLAIFWIATSYLAAGIFVAPLIARREPKGQNYLAYGLLGALVIVVVGSLLGEFAGIFGIINKLWLWFGNQGWEYLDLGRFWQILLSIGLLIWVIILFRGLRGRLAKEHFGNMPWLFFFAALAIPAFYAVGLLAHPAVEYVRADYWRWWVVHLWVEDFLEIFTTVMVAYIFVLLGVVREKVATALILLDFIIYSAGGVIGTMHHMYFSGGPADVMALGAVFSAAEVVPLTFLTLEAWSFIRLGTAQAKEAQTPFPHKWAVMFLVAVGFWNFLGAGIFGFLINLPIVSYYEIGTALTANHGHAAFMGVYGMLAVGFAIFCLRYIIPAQKWSDKAAKFSFWALNIGLAWMCLATLFPLGIIQLYHSVSAGYFEARSLGFLFSKISIIVQWLRFPGDVLFILGILGVVYIAWKGLIHKMPSVTLEELEEVLFTEITDKKSSQT